MVSILNSFITTSQPTPASAGQSVNLFKVGQLLTINIQQTDNQKITFSVGSQTLTASTKEAMIHTGQVQVKVAQTHPSVVLKIVQAPQATTPQAQQSLQSAYRQFMPNQTGIAQAFQQITLLQNLPPSILGSVNQLLEQVLKASQPLSGNALKQNIIQSGLFLESKLKLGDVNTLNKDLKAQLLSLKQQVESLAVKSPSPQLAQLLNHSTQAINRLTFQQLQLFETPFIMGLDMPFNLSDSENSDHIEFRRNTDRPEKSWEVLLDIHLPLGQMTAKMTLNDQDEIRCLLWTDSEVLASHIRANLPRLEDQLATGGLNLEQVQLVQTKPHRTQNTTQVALIDIHI
ncbi:MAG: flagellar hook-length control protein FliK [Gammaproteobacteria bacterium]|nr:flagellar hook-length control protein FliK [Gammaproteobacteria bacterium]